MNEEGAFMRPTQVPEEHMIKCKSCGNDCFKVYFDIFHCDEEILVCVKCGEEER